MEGFTFVVRDGSVIDFSRYIAVLREHGVSPTGINQLRVRLSQVYGTRRAIVEVANGTASLSLRPLSARPMEITVDSAGVLDQRRDPLTRSGADLGWQQGLISRTRADEGMLVDDKGLIISSFMSPFLMMKDGVVHASAHPRTTASIATDGVLDLLVSEGVEVRWLEQGFRRDHLMSHETWSISGVYGARLVTGWLEYGGVVPARTGIDRMGIPTHREVNEMRELRYEIV
ncbi:hypothetical protein [Corynebacterium cystitidis]|uniref:hypothetical protein n=1 Tax=Corynebacterium cystitidis TaxID=35757 RepID=UPI00211E7844|nr:hypothetical protein [Corynebacterium cystitidis]